jgi:hypothetical protein
MECKTCFALHLRNFCIKFLIRPLVLKTFIFDIKKPKQRRAVSGFLLEHSLFDETTS